MLKSYFKRENLVLYVEKMGVEKPNLPCWEGNEKPIYNPELNLHKSLIQVQKEKVTKLLTKYKEVFSNKPGRDENVERRIGTGEVKLISVSPYRITGKYAK